MSELKVGCVTLRGNAITHYLKDGQPLCGVTTRYNYPLEKEGVEPICKRCKVIAKMRGLK